MKIKELKEYLNSLPSELDNFDVVYSKTQILDESTKKWAREDMSADSMVVDQDTEELCIGAWESINTILRMNEVEVNQPELPDGEYPCLWSGYEIKLNFDGNEYTFDTHVLGRGVKGMNCPAVVTIKNNKLENAQAR